VIDDQHNRRSAGSPHRLVGAPNLNQLWADLLIEELVRSGVGLFCLASGSRSAPLAIAVAGHPDAERLIHYDERGCAFAALGWARATGRPACWITTSGTAVANGFPAIVEASADGVPLIALTADRPPELRQTGANQTIEQPGIFGAYVRWQFDLPAPSADVDPAFVLSTADQAVHRALSPPGPVHLNAMFREPLAPVPQPEPLPGLPRRWLVGDAPYTRYQAPAGIDATAVEGLSARLAGIERGLLVAGRLRTRVEADAALRLAEHLGWPLIPDVCSQLRLGPDNPSICRHADLVLGSEHFTSQHRPEAVIYLGGRAASKRLSQFLTRSGANPFVVVRDDPFRFDPDHLITDRIQGDVAAFCDAAVAGSSPRGAAEWQASWRSASDAIAELLADRLDGIEALSEPGAAQMVSRSIPPDHGLVVASSMPVRDVDTFADGLRSTPTLVVANRGASGIDGTVATAAGLARGLRRPATLLIGDLALLHDLSSLALLRDPAQPPVTIVVMNNDGGGIFHFLPVSEYPQVFESLFGTPHGMGFEDAAHQFGLDYERPESAAALGAAYGQAVESGRSSIIEVVTDRVENHALHQRLFAAAAAAIERESKPEAA
jgi:2-succinyl-5-enolpyruvyl-6-hydroxy-3-cyclohexene-1-carboxylate synthase